MCGPATVAAAVKIAPVIKAVSGALTTFATIKSLTGGGQKQPQLAPPQVQANVPTVAPDKTSFDYPDEREAPAYLQLSRALTPLQARTQIATQGVSGEGSQWRDPDTVSYYQNLALRSFVDPQSGSLLNNEFTPIEQQYITQALGQTPRSEGTGGFLNALLRA